jgi:stage IV sporulation protein FB
MFLGKIAGVSLRINLLFLVSCVIYGCLGLLYEVILITSAVLLHEIAHTAVALLNGVKVSEIELYPFGGQAQDR